MKKKLLAQKFTCLKVGSGRFGSFGNERPKTSVRPVSAMPKVGWSLEINFFFCFSSDFDATWCYFRDAEAPNGDIAESLFTSDDDTANLENLSNVFNQTIKASNENIYMNRKFTCFDMSNPKVKVATISCKLSIYIYHYGRF